MKLRPATMDDAALLFEWANDPAVRSASLESQRIYYESHCNWLTQRLERGAFYIAEVDGDPIGYARVDLYAPRTGALSVSVDEEYRGKGLGRQLIAAAAARAVTELDGIDYVRAEVKADNEASLSAFRYAGFIPTGTITLEWQPSK